MYELTTTYESKRENPISRNQEVTISEKILSFVFGDFCSPNDRKIYIDYEYLHFVVNFSITANRFIRLIRPYTFELFLLFVVYLASDIIFAICIEVVVSE